MSITERRHVPEPGTVHRLEIFTGAGRRRTWPAEAPFSSSTQNEKGKIARHARFLTGERG